MRVFILDGHQVSRQLAKRVIDSTPGVQLVGTATSPFSVRKAVRDSKPDVLVMNLACRTSKRLQANVADNQLFGLPVVTIPQTSADYDWHSIALHRIQYEKYAAALIQAVKSAVQQPEQVVTLPETAAPIQKPQNSPLRSQPMRRNGRQAVQSKARTSPSVRPIRPKAGLSRPLIVIGASGGDLDAMKVVLAGLQSLSTGILVAQQISATFDQHYLQALAEISSIPVETATEGAQILPDKILLAPSDQHIEVIKQAGQAACHFVSEAEEAEIAGRKPSLDRLFASLANNVGSMGIGILMLGTGSEGVEGVAQLRKAGANVLVQENDWPSNPVLKGTIASAAIMNGGEELIVPLTAIATQVSQIISGQVGQAV